MEVGCAEGQTPQAKIDAGDAPVLRRALFENGRAANRRDRVGHLQNGRHAARRRRPRRVFEVFLVCQSWITRMDMRVNEARKYQHAPRIDLLVDCFRRGFADALSKPIATHHVRADLSATRDEGAIGDPEPHAGSLYLWETHSRASRLTSGAPGGRGVRVR